MDLGSYLLKPVQRMGKYALLLKQIMKECPQSDQEYQDLRVSASNIHLHFGKISLIQFKEITECCIFFNRQLNKW